MRPMRPIIPFINRVPFSEKFLFAKNLALMIKAGLPLREAVATIQEQSRNKTFKKILDDVIKSIDNGQPLAQGLSRHPSVFDNIFINMIRIGEESGTLEENLGHLISHLEKSQILRRKVQAAMLYPSIIFTALFGLSLGIIFFVLPKIIPVFKALNIKLPLATRILIRFIEIVQNYGLFIILGIFGLVVIFFLLLRLPSVKFLFHKLILKIPIAGTISKNVNISNFARTLGILLRSGIAVVTALDITRTTLGNLVYQKELENLSSEVQKGKSISDYLRKKEKIFPLMVSRTIRVGEKTGNLEETLLYVGEFYEAEVDKSVKNLSTILEPILLVLIGLVVGFIALAIITPIYEITRGLRM